MVISNRISRLMENSSWIRAMFEEGERLKKAYGAENVFDFTLGNPITEPPKELKKEICDLLSRETSGMHRYMSNSGYEEVREQIAAFHRENSRLPFTGSHIIMTVGSAGAINVTLKALLDPGDEVIVLSPFFVEFMFYIENHGGVMKLVETREDFHIDVDAVEKAITERTKAIILNSPNNPTGVVYHEKEIRELAAILEKKRGEGQRIFIISDEAYRKIVYDNVTLPDAFNLYADTVAVFSHSKDLGLAGERIGYIAVSPRIDDQGLIDAMIFANRILGFINAPALMQRLVGRYQKNSVDVADYRQRRNAIYSILVEAGFNVKLPEGTFYIFPKSPIVDDVELIRVMLEHRILAVPGVGFGRKGYFRIAYCVEMDVIEKSRQAFLEVGALFR
ncbi:MAG TPA: pyridoxal phosphate-dependent aminotransferase [Syntrophorhabdales bacterium]|nr:pyridoxal phosphate-dependent aminotransferase [Syntrophorhabdales bacterium]